MYNKKIWLLMVISVVCACTLMSGAAFSQPTEDVSSVGAEASDTQQIEQDVDNNDDEDEIKGTKASFTTAQELMDKKDYNSAIEYLNAFISAKPKKYEGYKLRGDAFYAMRQYSLAEKDYQKAIELKTDADKFITNTKVISAVVLGADKNEQLQNPELGCLYARLMYAQKALNLPYEASYETALKYNSHIYLPKPNKSENTAINCPQKYGKVLNPQGDERYFSGAVEDIEHSNFLDALLYTSQLRKSYPNYYMSYYLSGVAFIGMDNEKEAIESFNRAIALNPNDFESMASLGQIYYYDAEKTFSVSKAKKSIDYFNLALKYNPNCSSYYFYIGINQLLLGDIADSINSFTSAVKLNPNDYNSLCYRLIAQYIMSDYKSVIDGATNLLYKRVSNYNSILYLRALAYYKTGAYDSALKDLDAIQNNVNDIFNEDVVVKSEKEKTLDSYTYYLKAKIMEAQGGGAKSDLQKAFNNPIIRKLASVQKHVEPFTNVLNSKSLTEEEYQKYNNFYMGEIPSLLKSNLEITEKDVELQYDYIRTTFSDLGIRFVYINPYYELTYTPDYILKKYPPAQLQHTSDTDKNTQTADAPKNEINETAVKSEPAVKVEQPLKKESNVEEILVKENETSVAQALASNALFAPSIANKSISEAEKILMPTPEVEIAAPETGSEKFEAAADKPEDNPEKSAVSTEQPVLKIQSEETDNKTGKIIIKAQEVKQTVEKPVSDGLHNVKEKHAKVNPEDYDFVHKQAPVTDENTDVIELVPQAKGYSIPEQLSQPFGFSYPQKITDNFSSVNGSKSIKTSEEIAEEDERIVLPEDKPQVQEESVEVAVVKVPELSKEVKKTAGSTEPAVVNNAEKIEGVSNKSSDTASFLDLKDEQQTSDNLETGLKEMKSDFEPAPPTRKERAAAKKAEREAKKAEKARLAAEKKAAKKASKQDKKQAAKDSHNGKNEIPVLRPVAIISPDENTLNNAVDSSSKDLNPEQSEESVKVKKEKKVKKQKNKINTEEPVASEKEEKINSLIEASFGMPDETEQFEPAEETSPEQVKAKKAVKHSQKKSQKGKEAVSSEFEPLLKTEDVQEVSSDATEVKSDKQPRNEVKNKKEKAKVTQQDNSEKDIPEDGIKPVKTKHHAKNLPEPVEVINHNGVEKKVIKKYKDN